MSLTVLRRVALLLAFGLLAATTDISAAQKTSMVKSVIGTPGLTITKVSLEAGRLKINGSAPAAGRTITIKGTSFSTVSASNKTFAFNVNYRTPDCLVTLVATGGEITLNISNCGPHGILPRGNWSSSAQYKLDDLVFHLGSSWRALRNNHNVAPGSSAPDWQLFAQKGGVGDQGPQGPQGPEGISPSGEWDSEATYETNDLVFHNGSTWRALVDDPTTEPGDGSPESEAEWEVFAQVGGPGLNPLGAWDDVTTYQEDDLVLHDGSTWRALQETLNNEPGHDYGTYWEIFAQRGDQGPQAVPYAYEADCAPLGTLDMGAWQLVCEMTIAEAGLYRLIYTMEVLGEPPTAGGSCPTYLETDTRSLGNEDDVMPAQNADEEPKFTFGPPHCATTHHTGVALHSFTQDGGTIQIQVFGTATSPSDATMTAVVKNAVAIRIGSAVPPICGNSVLTAPEQCDDGNLVNGDGCSDTCVIEPPICGNSVIQAGEQCDDGNIVDGDGCSSTCQTEPPPPVCGNTDIEVGEQCDDGNIADGDGCSSTCQIEPPPVCGNTVIEVGEQCDDGNTANGDGCSDICQDEEVGQ